MTRKSIGLTLVVFLFVMACSGVPGLSAPTPTALPMPTDFPQDTPTPEAKEPGEEIVTDEAGNIITEEPAEEPTEVPELDTISADTAASVVMLTELKADDLHHIAISPLSDALASAEGNSVIIYNVPWPAGATKLEGHTAKVNAVSWSIDGIEVASASDDGTVRVWDSGTGEELARWDVDGSPVLALAWSPDSLTIAAGTRKGIVKLIDRETGEATFTLEVSPQGVALGAITWSSDSTELATALYQGPVNPGDIEVWDAIEGEPLEDAKIARNYTAPGPTGIAWSPFDEVVAWVNNNQNGQVSLWEVGGDKTSVGYNEQNKVDTIAWAPDGDMIASGGADHMIHIWDTIDGAQLAELKGGRDTIGTLGWSADGTFIVSAGVDGVIRIWGAPLE